MAGEVSVRSLASQIGDSFAGKKIDVSLYLYL